MKDSGQLIFDNRITDGRSHTTRVTMPSICAPQPERAELGGNHYPSRSMRIL